MRVAGGVFAVQTDMIHKLQYSRLAIRLVFIDLMDIERFAYDIGYGHARVKRGIRILKDHGGAFAEIVNLALGAYLLTVEEYLAACRFI